MSLATPVRRIPASTTTLLTTRHEALVSAYRADRTPESELPSVFRLAREVVRRQGHLELYQSTG